MESVLAMYLGTRCTYLLAIARQEEGYAVQFARATEEPLEISGSEVQNIQSLKDLHDFLPPGIQQLAIAFPMDYVYLSHIPLQNDALDRQQLYELIREEVVEHFGDSKLQGLEWRVLQLAPRLDQRSLAAVLFIESEVKQALEKIAATLNLPLQYYDTAQDAIVAAFLLNYPEWSQKNSIVMHVQDLFLDITPLRKGVPVVYNLLRNEGDTEKLLHAIEREMRSILSNYLSHVDVIAVCGEALTREFLQQLQRHIPEIIPGVQVIRLNAFRSFLPPDSERLRKYCIRTAHLYVPCVGIALMATVAQQSV